MAFFQDRNGWRTLRTPRNRRAAAAAGGRWRASVFSFSLVVFSTFPLKAPMAAPAGGAQAGEGGVAGGAGEHSLPFVRRPEGPHRHAATARLSPRARPPHGRTCAPQAATHRSRGRRGPSSSGTARCSASGTRRRRLLFASCRCPRPPVLRSGIFLTSIFHSAAIKWKMLLKPREVTLK